ncbi:MAG TPA: hypothetical protein HA257_01040, partial [Candidatus Methanoperedenaceae archaeon]|nr:hypothetical protein [Candidatus Methanoperedenaceae archaeon]
MSAWDRIDISNKSTLNSTNRNTALSLYSINSTSVNATFHTPDSAVPCIICHGPMHNITKPNDNERFTRDPFTESENCLACHKSYAKHDAALNCTVCHSEDVHVIQVFAQNATFVTYNKSNPNPARGNCTTCHQNASFLGVLRTQAKADPYSGNAPQVPRINHSQNIWNGALWNRTGPAFWTNTSELSKCNYCHGDTKHNTSALGKPDKFDGNNTVRNFSTWCGTCHYQFNPFYRNMTTNITPVPPEISSNATYGNYPSGARDGTSYYNHSLSGNYTDARCTDCHKGASISNVTVFLHDVRSGGGGPDCISCHDVGQSNAKINNSAM